MTTFGAYQDALLQHNSNVANPSVIHNHLAGRTNIADHTTEKPILADADGHLKVQLHDQHSGHLNNSGAIGDGTTVLRTVDLGYDRANGQGRSKLVDSAGRQVVNLTGNSATDGTGTNYHIKADSGGHALVDLHEKYAGAGNNNIGEGSTKLQIYNYGRDVSAGNFKPMVVNSSAEQIVALSSTDNAVLDTIATNTANIKVSTDSVNLNVDGLETLVGSTNTALTTIDGVLDNIKLDTAAIKTAVELLDNCVSGNELQVDIVSGGGGSGGDASASNQSTMITHLSEIEGAVETLEGCVGSSKVNVNISSGNITGFATESTLSAAEVHLGNVESKLGTIETDIEATNTALATIDGVLDNAEAHLGNIDAGVDVLEACVGSNKVNVNISSGNISGFATESTLSAAEVHLGNVESKLGTIETDIEATNTLLTTLDGVQDNVLTKLTEIDNAVDTLDGVVDLIKAKTDLMAITTTQCHNNVSIAGSSSDTNSTLITLGHNPRSITIFARDHSGAGSIAGSQITISPMVSMDNSNFFDLSTAVSSGGGSPNQISVSELLREKIVVIENCRFPFLKVKITNGSSGAISFTSHVCF